MWEYTVVFLTACGPLMNQPQPRCDLAHLFIMDEWMVTPWLVVCLSISSELNVQQVEQACRCGRCWCALSRNTNIMDEIFMLRFVFFGKFHQQMFFFLSATKSQCLIRSVYSLHLLILPIVVAEGWIPSRPTPGGRRVHTEGSCKLITRQADTNTADFWSHK